MFGGLERFSVSAPGRVVNEYRIHSGKLELRTRNPEAKPAAKGYWRKLETNEILLHLVLNTVVGQWLMGRRGFHTILRRQGFPSSKLVYNKAA